MNYPMEELLPIVAKVARKYTSGESSSVSYETAQSLMEGILYCIAECEEAYATSILSKKTTAEECYQMGKELVMNKVEQVRQMLNEMADTFDSYGLRCLYDTVMEGMPQFLKWYDVRFFPQETLLTLDYPILTDIHKHSGVDAINRYLCAIRAEQTFLSRFPREYIVEVLRKNHEEYEELIENIIRMVLPNVIGHFLLRKPMTEVGFQPEELARLAVGFADCSRKELEKQLEQIMEHMVSSLYPNEKELLDYLLQGVRDLAVRMEIAVKHHQMEKLFLA